MVRESDGLVEATAPLPPWMQRYGNHAVASARSSLPAGSIRRASGRASDRRRWYLNAWMLARSDPSQEPAARRRDPLNQILTIAAHDSPGCLSRSRSQAAQPGAQVRQRTPSQRRRRVVEIGMPLLVSAGHLEGPGQRVHQAPENSKRSALPQRRSRS